MVQIPEDLARSIQAGDWVLWVGAGFGSLAGRPGWDELLEQLIPECPQESHASLRDLLEQGRLRTVLTYVHRHLGDEPLARMVKKVSTDSVELKSGAAGLRDLPWRACFSTVYDDVARAVFTQGDDVPTVLAHSSVHYLSLRDQEDFFILKTPPTGRSMRTDSVLFDFVEEVVRSRTMLFLGFGPDDPDLAQILQLLDRIGPGNRHYAALGMVSDPEAEEWLDRWSVEVIQLADGDTVGDVLAQVQAATADVAVRPSDVAGALAILDLTRAVRGVEMRADVARDEALTLDLRRIEELVDALPGKSLNGVPAATLLRCGAVMLANRCFELARRCFQHVVARGVDGEMMHVARFNLALTASAEGDHSAALDGLVSISERSLAIIPPRFELVEVLGHGGTQIHLTCRDRGSKDLVDVSVSTLPRPVGIEEQAKFTAEVHKLAAVDHPAVAKAKGGFADGRLFGVTYDPAPGFVLADTLDAEKPMTLDQAAELLLPVIDGLRACHEVGVLHRNINPRTVVVGEKTAMLRSFGFPPVIGFMRPSVREENRGFIAPEVAAGAEATPKSDTYSLAALLYYCLAGRAPSGSVPRVSVTSEVDPRIDELLDDGLHPDPAKRTALLDLKERLEHIVSTPGLGEAQRLVGAEAEPGREEVVDLGRPRVATDAPAKIKAPDDPDDLEAWSWILERKPMHAEALENIDRIDVESREQQRWDRVVEVLAVRAQHAQVRQARVTHLREMVVLFETKLGAPRNAFESLQALIEEVDATEQVQLMGELGRLAEVAGQWPALADSLVIVARRAPEVEDQARLQTELGDVFAVRLGADDQALVAYEKAIELEATGERLEKAIGLYRKQGADAELAGALVSLADLERGVRRHDVLLQAAKVLREALDDPEGALGCVDIVLAESSENEEALVMAQSLARQLEDWDRLYEVLSKSAELSSDTAESVELRREAIAVAKDHRHDIDAMILQLIELTQADRNDKAAATELADLLRERVGANPAHRTTLVDTLGILVDLVDAPEAKASLLSESALHLDQLADGKNRAVDCREQILELLPPHQEQARAAATALQAVYRRQEAFSTLEAMLLRQAESEGDAEFRGSAWAKLLELRTGALADEDGAVAALEHLTALQPGETDWRDQLLALYLQREQFQKAGPLIREQVFEEEDPKRKAELLLRGGMLREQIGKLDGAVEALEEAVSLDPTLIAAWQALREIYLQNDQPIKAAEALVAGAKNNANRVEKVRSLYQAAKLYNEELARPERALELFETVVELDPDHRDAMTALLERLIGQGELTRAWPHAQVYVMQVRSQAANDHKLNLRALSLAGRCALAVEEKDKARDYLEKAKSLDATNLDVLQLLGDLDLEAERWAEALRNYQSVVLGVGDKMSPPEMSRLYAKMGRARLGMGERAKSIQMFERALDIDAENEEAVTSLIEVGSEVGGAAAAVKAKQRLVEILRRQSEGSEDPTKNAERIKRRVDLLNEIVELQTKELKLPDEAVGTLERILEINPEDQAILHRILDVFTEGKRWRDATNVLERLAGQQESDQLKAKYLYAGALILRDNLGDRDQAVEWMKRVMQADPLHARAFDAYVEQLQRDRAWSDISKAIRTHLKALPKSTKPARLAELFANLGDAHEKMRDMKTALAALDQAAKLGAKAGEDIDTQNERRTKIMRLAIAQGDDELDKAVHHGHAMIADNPMELEVYHRLVEIYLKQGDRDRARAVSRTLRFLKQADEAEEELAGAGGGPSQVRTPIKREQWRKMLSHSSEDQRISDMFAITWPMVAAREGRTHAHRGVARADRIEVTIQSPTAISRYVAHACQMFDVSVPDLYQTDSSGDILVDALAEGSGAKRTVFPSLLAGKAACSDTEETSLKFRAGRAVARVGPDHLLASVLESSSSVRHAIFGAIHAARPDFPLPDDVVNPAKAHAEQIQAYIQPSRLEGLRTLAESVFQGGEVDAKAWMHGVVFTTTRAGFVLCDSLDVAAQLLTREGDAGSTVSAKERIADLVAYSVSEQYLKLRKHAGLNR